ncbi:MAG TPA: alpha-isopropylmalate synthase regulatory domain-containing protein, partial [Halanaerobiales bacterium]|nr:alpha-isopropylmalate synthase regulatory domain-containing protein [Halanaerobiales bacterium]
FAHSSGIHQDGLMKSRDVYEIIDPAEVGCTETEMVLTARSGRHAFQSAIEKLGFNIEEEEDFEVLFQEYLDLADKKKEVYYNDLFYLVEDYYIKRHGKKGKENGMGLQLYELVNLQVISNDIFPTASVKIKKGEEVSTDSATGDGPVDALYTALHNIVGFDINLKEYKISNVSRGKEALGRVTLQLLFKDRTYPARAIDTDIIKASALAYLNGINRIIIENR